jgi:hypothetical protein
MPELKGLPVEGWGLVLVALTEQDRVRENGVSTEFEDDLFFVGEVHQVK